MKKLLAYMAAALGLSALAACGGTVDRPTTATGAPYEIVVSVAQPQWDGAVGDTLRAVLLEEVPMLNQAEPQFDVLRIVPAGMDKFIRRHRNILLVRVGGQYPSEQISVAYDVYSRPQVVVTMSAPDDASMAAFISDNRRELAELFLVTERERALSSARAYKEKALEQQVMRMFGMKIDIPRGYRLRNVADDDFIWMSNEYPQASQGLVIYSYPYTGRQDFEPGHLIAARARFVSLIPGPSEGSYMVTSPYIDPQISYMRIDGRFWAELRGFWDVENDFMGGPMVSYSTLDTRTNRVVTLDLYVYSPKQHKRNLLRGLESIIYSVEFPEEEPASESR